MPNVGSALPALESVRPQSLMLTLLGAHVLGRDVAVFTGSYIAALARVGVSEQATRSTLARMARRGLLERHRRGRRVYYGLTPRSTAILEEGRTRLREGIERTWDGTWTVLGFSLPQAWRRQRHALRSRLAWAGFGCLQSGLWVAPGEVDVPSVVGDFDLLPHVRVFSARVAEPTRDAQIVREVYDLDELARRYRAFLERWESRASRRAADAFAEHLLLATDWLLVVRLDPRLPLSLLPRDWPARRAQSVFRRRERALAAEAAAIARELLEAIPVEMPAHARVG